MTTPAAGTLTEVLSLVPPPARPFDNGAAGVARLVTSRPCLLYGWVAANTAGAAAETCDLLAGDDVNGQLVAHIGIPAGATVVAGPGAPGVLCQGGLYIGNVGADVRIVVYIVQL